MPTPGTAQRIFTTLLISHDEEWGSGHAREGTGPSTRQKKEGADEWENEEEEEEVAELHTKQNRHRYSTEIHTTTLRGIFICRYIHFYTHTHSLTLKYCVLQGSRLYMCVWFAYCAFLLNAYNVYLHCICIYVLHLLVWLPKQQPESPYCICICLNHDDLCLMTLRTSSICIKAYLCTVYIHVNVH